MQGDEGDGGTGRDRRAYARVDLYAQVELPHEGQVELLVAHNLSEGGLFLAARPHECPWLVPGIRLELAIVLADRVGDASADELLVQARGRVVHRDRGAARGVFGVGVEFEEIDDENRRQLRALVARARGS